MSASTRANEQLTACFFGTSDEQLFNKLELSKVIDEILLRLISVCKENKLKSLRLLTGGYQGIMHYVATKSKSLSEEEEDIVIRNLGVTVSVPIFRSVRD